MEIRELEPKVVWKIFHEITQIPRPSKKEEKILNWLKEFASERGYKTKEDSVGNLLISAPATKGNESKKRVCIQAHVDMVTEKNRGSDFDFDNDPIQTYIDNGWVKAKGTTLGADNGMGLAMGLAIINDDSIPRPAIDVLCTVDEETGLTGANQLSSDLIECDILINLDTEEFGHFTIGCAGGINTIGEYPLKWEDTPQNLKFYEFGIKGLKGGHSGLEISSPLANSNSLLFRYLWNIDKRFDVKVSNVMGGNKHNAIPRESFVRIAIDEDKADVLEDYTKEFGELLKAEWSSSEPNIEVVLETADSFANHIEENCLTAIVESLYTLYHGVYRMHPTIDNFVQSSTNFAAIETKEDIIHVLTSQRSSLNSEKYNLANIVRTQLTLGGAEAHHTDGYPAWEPSTDSEILNTGIEIYKRLFNQEPVIEAVHAGLECGIIADKTDRDIDMISFGPDIRSPHTPEEKIEIDSTAKCWDLLVKLIKNI